MLSNLVMVVCLQYVLKTWKNSNKLTFYKKLWKGCCYKVSFHFLLHCWIVTVCKKTAKGHRTGKEARKKWSNSFVNFRFSSSWGHWSTGTYFLRHYHNILLQATIWLFLMKIPKSTDVFLMLMILKLTSWTFSLKGGL